MSLSRSQPEYWSHASKEIEKVQTDDNAYVIFQVARKEPGSEEAGKRDVNAPVKAQQDLPEEVLSFVDQEVDDERGGEEGDGDEETAADKDGGLDACVRLRQWGRVAYGDFREGAFVLRKLCHRSPA